MNKNLSGDKSVEWENTFLRLFFVYIHILGGILALKEVSVRQHMCARRHSTASVIMTTIKGCCG